MQEFGGSFQGFIEAFQRRHNHDGTALQLAQMVTDTFPSFRDEHWFEGRRSQYDSTRLVLFSLPPITPALTSPAVTPHRVPPHVPIALGFASLRQSSSGNAPKS